MITNGTFGSTSKKQNKVWKVVYKTIVNLIRTALLYDSEPCIDAAGSLYKYSNSSSQPRSTSSITTPGSIPIQAIMVSQVNKIQAHPLRRSETGELWQPPSSSQPGCNQVIKSYGYTGWMMSYCGMSINEANRSSGAHSVHSGCPEAPARLKSGDSRRLDPAFA
jgi:hypothetical protein